MLDLEADVFEAVFDAVDCGLVLLDSSSRVLAWNGWMVSATAVSRKAAVGRRLDQLFSGPRIDYLSSAIADAIESGTARLLTHSLHPHLLPLKTRAGHELIHDITVQAVREKPNAKCLLQITDITVQAHRERVLRQRQNARYDAVVDTAPDAILTLDTRGLIQLVNPAAARAFGYAANELVGEHISVLIGNPEPWEAAWKAVLEGDVLSRPIEVVATTKDGMPTYVEISASHWLSDSRVFVTVILHDVSERRAAEEAQRSLNQTLERRVAERTADRNRMWRLSTDVMMVTQLDGTINATNPAWTQLLGWHESEVIGANVLDFIPTEDKATFLEVLRSFSGGGKAKLFEVSLRTQHNGIRTLEWSAVAADRLLHAVGRDVTAEREKERALREVEDALRHAQKMEAIGQLTGGIAHDFNNLLMGIIGAMNLLKRRIAAGKYDDTERFMEAAVTSANRAAALTHRLLAFARRQPLDPKAVDANQLVLGMEELLRRSLSEQITMTLKLEPEPWPTLTDANQLENALLNLVINARDAMPKGGLLTIATRNSVIAQPQRSGADEISAGDYTVISVRDTGMGIAPDLLPRIFDPFFTTKPLGQGTGLGLSMIYGFAKQSRGNVRVESAEGQGTTVSIYLPRHEGENSERCFTPERHDEIPAGEGETVLLVEDDSSVRLLIAEVLRDLGYACIEASDGHAALAILNSGARLDLMISDVGLPGLNGRQLAEMARRNRPDLKVLFVTGYAEQATGQATFLDAGMAMVTKPVVLDDLALKIRQMISA